MNCSNASIASATREVPTVRLGRLLRLCSAKLALREIVPSLAGSATERQVRDDLGTLRVLGLTISVGHGRGARWKRL